MRTQCGNTYLKAAANDVSNLLWRKGRRKRTLVVLVQAAGDNDVLLEQAGYNIGRLYAVREVDLRAWIIVMRHG